MCKHIHKKALNTFKNCCLFVETCLFFFSSVLVLFQHYFIDKQLRYLQFPLFDLQRNEAKKNYKNNKTTVTKSIKNPELFCLCD